jgi:surface carbohydrate biosynthesis protein
MIKTKLIFKNPARNKIAIFFSGGPWHIDLILNDLPRTQIGSFDQEIYISIKIILNFFKQLWRFKFDRVKARNTFKSKLKSILSELYCHYWIACVSQTEAKVVLCFADNYFIYQRISILDRNREYYGIQNGMRTLHDTRDALSHSKVISMTNFFCFGERDIDIFTKQKHLIEKYIPVGSLIGGYYKTEVSSGTDSNKFDICLISPWIIEEQETINGKFGSFYARYYKQYSISQKILFKFLAKFIDETKSKIVVCLRTKDEAEENTYRQLFTSKAKMSHIDREKFQTYREVEKSELVISIFSTVLLDAFSWGSKVLYTNMGNSEWFEVSEAGISYYHKNDYDSFKKKVIELLEMDIGVYRKLTKKKANYINNFNPERPAHKIIRETILKKISGGKAP